MEAWDYIRILEKPNRALFFGKEKHHEEKLLALSKLSQLGYPRMICNLIPFLKDDSENIRAAALQTIQTLFEKLKSKTAYYESLKHCSISSLDIRYYRENYSEKEFIFLLKIASLNHNGYIREEALNLLGNSNDETVIPFIVFRLADWVENVRYLAEQELKKFFKPDYIFGLIDNLSLFQWLQKVERSDLSRIYNEVIDFLIEKNRAQTIRIFKKINDKERRILANEFSEDIQSNSELNLFLTDKHFLIRLLALEHFEKLIESQKVQLLKDPSGKVRQKTLYCYRGKKEFKNLLPNYLADSSGAIRHLARFYLKEEKLDYKDFYLNKLEEKNQIIGSLLGLLDIDARDCEENIKPYLNNEKVSIAKTAFYVLSNFNVGMVYQFAKENMFTSKVGLRKRILDYLGRYPSEEIINMAREKFKKESDETLKLTILRLFSRIGGYAAFPDLLLGTIDKNETIRNHANLYVQKWRQEATSMFKQPTTEEKNRALKVFEYVKEVHQQKSYFESNPVKGLDFYLK